MKLKLLKASPADVGKVCAYPLSLRNDEVFSQMIPDEYARRHHLTGGLLSSLYAPPPSLSLFGAASVMMWCSDCPASSSSRSVLAEDRVGHNILRIT